MQVFPPVCLAYELTEERSISSLKRTTPYSINLLPYLKDDLTPLAFEEVLRDIGRSFSGCSSCKPKDGDMESRVGGALAALEAIGGAARVEEENERKLRLS
jgi:hypothetical protein